METINQIKELVENLSVDTTKFFDTQNKSAGLRARKGAQQIKNLCQQIRKEILEENKK
jgi:hypothetical protein